MASQTVRHELATEQQKFSFKVNGVFKVKFLFNIKHIMVYTFFNMEKTLKVGCMALGCTSRLGVSREPHGSTDN